MVGAALRHVAVSAKLMTETMPKALATDATEADAFTRARIERDRRAAITRYLRDRDVAELQATMARLDAEESQAKEQSGGDVTREQARHYLANPSELWKVTEPEGQRAIAVATLDRIEAVGLDLVIHPGAEAEHYGWSRAFGSDPLVCSIGRSGRGERTWPRGTYLIARGSTEGLRLPSADEAQEGGARVVGVGGGSPSPIAHVGKGPHPAQ